MKRHLTFIATLAASPVLAEDARQLDAHEHGVGALNIAVDGTTVAMEFHAPGADIVGFEYAATSDEDRASIDAAVATLARPLDLFTLPDAAECTVISASAMLESEAEHDDHDHEEHADDEHAEHDDHNHDEHAEHDEHKDDHEEHAEHDHDDHADEASHTEFHAEYTLNCANPGDLSEITFAYFETFENALELEVQILTESGAQAFEVERDEPTLDLQQLF